MVHSLRCFVLISLYFINSFRFDFNLFHIHEHDNKQDIILNNQIGTINLLPKAIL
jgi:hypothetical protein